MLNDSLESNILKISRGNNNKTLVNGFMFLARSNLLVDNYAWLLNGFFKSVTENMTNNSKLDETVSNIWKHGAKETKKCTAPNNE